MKKLSAGWFSFFTVVFCAIASLLGAIVAGPLGAAAACVIVFIIALIFE